MGVQVTKSARIAMILSRDQVIVEKSMGVEFKVSAIKDSLKKVERCFSPSPRAQHNSSGIRFPAGKVISDLRSFPRYSRFQRGVKR